MYKGRTFVRVAELRDLNPGRMLLVEVNERQVALANVGGTIVALDNNCPHQGGPLAYGKLCANEVVCPWHGWRWDALTGRAVWPPVDWRVTRFPVRVEGNDVLVGGL